MKKIITLIVIASGIIFGASCRKEELPVKSVDSKNGCLRIAYGQNNLNSPGGNERTAIILVSACRNCHAAKVIAD